MSFTIKPVQSIDTDVVALVDSGGGSLQQRMAGEFARLSESASLKQDFLIDVIGEGSSDPMRLLRAQGELSKFHTEMSVYSALARKAVAVVETLVKS